MVSRAQFGCDWTRLSSRENMMPYLGRAASGCGTIPSTILDTDRAPAGARFALWRDAISATQGRPARGSDPARFSAYARGCNLGPSVVIETRATEQVLYPHVARGPRRPGRSLRHPSAASGPLARRCRRVTVEADPGNVMVLDMARPSGARDRHRQHQRDAAARRPRYLLPPFDMHGLRLHGAAAELLRSYLVALADNLPHLPSVDAPMSPVRPATSSPRASHHPATRWRGPTRRWVARFTEIRRYIDRHLSTPGSRPRPSERRWGYHAPPSIPRASRSAASPR